MDYFIDLNLYLDFISKAAGCLLCCCTFEMQFNLCYDNDYDNDYDYDNDNDNDDDNHNDKDKITQQISTLKGPMWGTSRSIW